MITIDEVKKDDSYVYNVAVNDKHIAIEMGYDEALEVADKLGRPVVIRYLSGLKPDFEAELQAKHRMDAKGWI